MDLGIDFSFAKIAPADIKAAGYKFVARYLASSSGKRITKSEADALRAAGLAVVLVFEDYANPKQNYDGDATATGIHDAQIALAQANAIGFPSDKPIYFAVDYDAPESDQQWINAYLNACASVLGRSRVGIYGGYYVVKRAADAGLVYYLWQTLAWSGGQIDPRTHIYQNGQSAFGGGADVDEAKQANYGQWGDSSAEGEEMLTRSQIATLWLLVYFKDLAQADKATQEAVYGHYEGKPIQELLNDFMHGHEPVVQQYLAGANAAETQKQIADLQAQVADLQKQLDAAKQGNGGFTPQDRANLNFIQKAIASIFRIST
jgi:hypothetical protein